MNYTDSKSQLDNFKATAREIGVDETDDALDRVMGKLDLKRKPEPKVTATAQQSSDKRL